MNPAFAFVPCNVIPLCPAILVGESQLTPKFPLASMRSLSKVLALLLALVKNLILLPQLPSPTETISVYLWYVPLD